MKNKAVTLLCCHLALLPLLASAGCGCDESEAVQGRDKAAALRYKLVAVASILVAGAMGVCLPLASKRVPALRAESDMFFMIKAFAAGVIMATGFVHILPDAFATLASPCLGDPWDRFPFAGFVAMIAAAATMTVDTLATSYYERMRFREGGLPVKEEAAHVVPEGHVHVHTHATHGHAHGSSFVPDEEISSSELVRRRVVSQVLEVGVVVHSVIIGVSLGASNAPNSIKPLVAALTFHQFFEGMGLGGCIAQAKFKCKAIATMAVFFSLTTPTGIAIGMGISTVYKETSQTALIVEGVFNSASAGILIYMALVDLLAADFMSPRMQTNLRLQLGANLSLLFGLASMSLLAKWA